VRSTFQNLFEIFSCFEPRLEGRTFAVSNFHVKASRFRTNEMVVRTVDLMHAIFISDARASGPRGLTSGRLDFECDTCLMNECVWMGFHIVRTVAANFPYLCFGKKSRSWSNTECRPDVLLKCSDEWKLEQFEASRHRGKFGRKVLLIWTDDALDNWASGLYITPSGRLAGNRIFLTYRLYRIFWKHYDKS
jgi:hypothetical protein